MLIGHENHIAYLQALAESKTLSHGYIFFGQDRIGKKTVALQFAHFLETGSMDHKGVLGDCLLVECNKENSIGIDAARDIKYFLSQRPNRSPYRTVIVDNAEYLTTQAQNALLKISEEAPPSGLCILVMRHHDMIRETLQSRFQKLYFGRVPEKEIQSLLVEEHGCPEEKARRYAKEAFGAPGRAYALYSDKSFQALQKSAETLLAASPAQATVLIKKFTGLDAFDLEIFLEALIEHVYLKKKYSAAFMKQLLAIRRQAAFFNLNPRLQLEALIRT
jgi:DNA polymerase III subunit delta'